MPGFYQDPFGPQDTLLAGDTTYNAMGLNAVPVAAPASSPGGFSTTAMFSGLASAAIGAYFSGQAAKYQAKIADTNARIAELSAQSSLYAGQKEVGRMTLRAGQLKGTQRATMAANGVALGVGNAAEIEASTDLMKEIDKQTIEANAVRGAFGYRTQAVNYQNEATMKRTVSPIGMAAGSLRENASGVARN